MRTRWVSIPSRGFWFFEVKTIVDFATKKFFAFQSPRGDFGFLKAIAGLQHLIQQSRQVSIPSRGFWFFEAIAIIAYTFAAEQVGFNPLAGILVF